MEVMSSCSPFGGIPRNWKHFIGLLQTVGDQTRSPFGGIPRNWKQDFALSVNDFLRVPPSGGSLEIGNFIRDKQHPGISPGWFPLRGDP